MEYKIASRKVTEDRYAYTVFNNGIKQAIYYAYSYTEFADRFDFQTYKDGVTYQSFRKW